MERSCCGASEAHPQGSPEPGASATISRTAVLFATICESPLGMLGLGESSGVQLMRCSFRDLRHLEKPAAGPGASTDHFN